MYDGIVDFAELHDFMDERLKNYSSGMQVRLAFSIAIRAEGDILLLDEVLAVGDEAFQKKCFDYFNQLKENKKTVILVSHDMESVRRFCNKAMLIEYGKIKVSGSPDDVASQYTLDNMTPQSKNETPASEDGSGDVVRVQEDKTVSLAYPITSLEIVPNSPLIVDRNHTFSFDVVYGQVDDTPVYVGIGLIYQGASIIEHGSLDVEPIKLTKTKRKITYNLPLNQFTQGNFKINATIIGSEDKRFLAFTTVEGACSFVIKESGVRKGGLLQKRGYWKNSDEN